MRIRDALPLGLALGLGACAPQTRSDGHPSGDPARIPAASAQPATAASLAGTRWMGVIDPSTDKRYAPWLEFVAQGRVSGYTGCNLLGGAWRSEGGEVRVGPLVTTKRACAGPERDIERHVLAALTESSRVVREGDKLVFIPPEGERLEFVQPR